jgi:hypothetical protein
VAADNLAFEERTRRKNQSRVESIAQIGELLYHQPELVKTLQGLVPVDEWCTERAALEVLRLYLAAYYEEPVHA